MSQAIITNAMYPKIFVCRHRNGENALVADAQETAKDAGITS